MDEILPRLTWRVDPKLAAKPPALPILFNDLVIELLLAHDIIPAGDLRAFSDGRVYQKCRPVLFYLHLSLVEPPTVKVEVGLAGTFKISECAFFVEIETDNLNV